MRRRRRPTWICASSLPRTRSRVLRYHASGSHLAEGAGDIVIFQQLPLHVKSRVLKEGRVLFVRDEDALYAVAIRAARAFEGFRHRYRAYLDEVARG